LPPFYNGLSRSTKTRLEIHSPRSPEEHDVEETGSHRIIGAGLKLASTLLRFVIFVSLVIGPKEPAPVAPAFARLCLARKFRFLFRFVCAAPVRAWLCK